jgi:hypothetical protein
MRRSRFIGPLKGANPAEQPIHFKQVVNLKVAKTFG